MRLAKACRKVNIIGGQLSLSKTCWEGPFLESRETYVYTCFIRDIALLNQTGSRPCLLCGQLPDLVRRFGIPNRCDDLVALAQQLADKFQTNAPGCAHD